MKAKLLIPLALLLAAVSFGVWWYVTKALPEQNPQEQTPSTDTPSEENPGEEEETPPLTTGSGEVAEISISGTAYSFNPPTVTVKRDTLVRLTFTNLGEEPHDLTIPALGVATPLVSSGSSRTVEFTVPSEPGSVEYICSVLGHKDLGMRGTLIIE